jgi:hypothetical protein
MVRDLAERLPNSSQFKLAQRRSERREEEVNGFTKTDLQPILSLF